MLEIINYNTAPRLSLTNATYPTAIQKIDNATSLRNYEPTFDKQVIFLLGISTIGVNSGHYRADFADTSTADNNDTVIVTIDGKRWKKIAGSGGGTDNAIVSDTTGIIGAVVVENMVALTQAQYDAVTPVSGVMYAIKTAGNLIEKFYFLSEDTPTETDYLLLEDGLFLLLEDGFKIILTEVA
jgi:hypothetical protein